MNYNDRHHVFRDVIVFVIDWLSMLGNSVHIPSWYAIMEIVGFA